MDVNGIVQLVPLLLKMGISMYLNGVVKMDVHGMRALVKLLKEEDIMMYCNGVSKMDAYAKYVVDMEIWFDGLLMELRIYMYIKIFY
jgi:hypothetical protein